METLQNLINTCIMIEQENHLGGNFGVDLKKAQEELDELTSNKSKKTVLVRYEETIESVNAQFDDTPRKRSRIVEVDRFTDLNDLFDNIIVIQILK